MPAGADERGMPEQGAAQHSLSPSQPPAQGGEAGADFPARVAAEIDRLQLHGVADFLLELFRPFGWLGAQVVLIAQPALSLFGESQTAAKLAAWLERITENKEGSRRL